MARWIDYGMFGFCINSNIKSKYQCSHHKAMRLPDLFSKNQRSDNLMAMWISYKISIKWIYPTGPTTLVEPKGQHLEPGESSDQGL